MTYLVKIIPPKKKITNQKKIKFNKEYKFKQTNNNKFKL